MWSISWEPKIDGTEICCKYPRGSYFLTNGRTLASIKMKPQLKKLPKRRRTNPPALAISSNSTFGKNRFKGKVHPFQTFTAAAVADLGIVGGFLICINLSVIMLPIYLCRVGLKSTLTCRQVKEAQKPLPIYAVGGTISVFSYKKMLKFDKSPI